MISSCADLLVGDTASVVLADANGTLAWRWESDPALRRVLDRVEIEAGHQYVEQDVGTCAVGLCMSERSMAVVVGREHYKRAWHPFTGATVPVVHPTSQKLLGSVTVCCRAEDTNRHVTAAVVAFSERIKAALRNAATPRQRRLVDAHMTFRADPRTTVITLDDQIMITDGGPATSPGRATLWAALREAGPATTRTILPDGAVATVRPVTPGRFDDGCVLIFDAAESTARDNAGSRHGPDRRGAGRGTAAPRRGEGRPG